MRISFSTATFYHRGLRHSLRLARDAGFDGVELAIGPEYFLRGEDALARTVEREGVPVLSVHPPFYPFPGWPRTLSARLERLTEVCCRVGTSLLVLHAPMFWHENAPRAAAYTKALASARSRLGDALTIGLESLEYSHRPHRRCVLDDLGALVRFAGERGCGITFDTAHAGANGEDLLASYEIVRPLLRNVHLSDVIWRPSGPRTHVLPGEGALPLRELLATLAGDGYDGLITMEIHPRHTGYVWRGRQLRRLRQALDFVRSAIE